VGALRILQIQRWLLIWMVEAETEEQTPCFQQGLENWAPSRSYPASTTKYKEVRKRKEKKRKHLTG